MDVADDNMKGLIGMKNISNTKMPNIAEIKSSLEKPEYKLYSIDCPGLMDSKGFIDDFTNSYFVMKIFEVIKEARFLLCVTESDMISMKNESLVQAIDGYLKYFDPKV